MAKFRYVQWCVDCTGQDYQGCYDGGSLPSEDEYESQAEAEEDSPPVSRPEAIDIEQFDEREQRWVVVVSDFRRGTHG